MRKKIKYLFILFSALVILSMLGVGYTFMSRNKLLKPVALKDVFHVSISSSTPAYMFRVVSSSSTANVGDRIEIFRDPNFETPLQIIQLSPDRRLADMAPKFFSVQDVNFDGFLDIGLPIDGGAKWSSYQYWTFDQVSGKFIRSPVTDDLRNIPFNFVSFDSQKLQITTDNLEGAGWRTLYQFQNGHIFPIKEEHLDNIVQDDQKASTTHPTLHCLITTTTYLKSKPNVVSRELSQECNRSMQTIAFDYPKEHER